MIRYNDLKAINKRYEPKITDAVARVAASGWYIRGKEGEAFEETFANYCGCRHCIGTGNGLDALSIILQAYRELRIMKSGDEIIVPANTFIATILAVIQAGLTPVLCEPDPHTFNIDTTKIESLSTSERFFRTEVDDNIGRVEVIYTNPRTVKNAESTDNSVGKLGATVLIAGSRNIAKFIRTSLGNVYVIGCNRCTKCNICR